MYLNNLSFGCRVRFVRYFRVCQCDGNDSLTQSARNNIIVNTSVQNGAGLTVAYRRSAGAAGTLANYAQQHFQQ